ncbi:UNVERIFIED_CONTAM: hypothetical protein FKN15_020153 [Acipenser sinensis]
MGLRDFCEYETIKLVRIRSVKLGSLKWSINGTILAFICIMLVWNKEYHEHDYVVSSVTAKVKGVAVTKDTDLEGVLWDVADHSGLSQGKDSFFVVTNAIVTKNQRQGSCPEVTAFKCVGICIVYYQRYCKDMHGSTYHSSTYNRSSIKVSGVQTGKCVDFDWSVKTCEVFAWCPIEKRRVGPKPAILGSAENFTVLIKNNIGFPNFNYTNRNILPHMNDTYLRGCVFNRTTDPYCPIFRLGDIVQEAGENFTEMAIEGGVIAIQINWECNLDRLFHKCVPEYSFRRLDEKNSNKTLFPGLNFRFARNYKQNGVEERTLFKVYGIRFDVMVFGKTTVLLDWFITTYVHPSCCSKEVKSNYTGKKYESVDLKQSPLYVSFVDEDHIAVVKGPFRKSLQEMKPAAVQVRRLHNESMRECLSLLQRPPSRSKDMEMREVRHTGENSKEHETNPPLWCRCGQCHPMPSLQEQLCCRRRVQTGKCVDFDWSVKTCEVFAWCPIEKRRVGPKPAILGSAENFTVLIKNNIGFPNFNYTNRNILPHMNDTYLRGCVFNRTTDPYCPIFRLGDIVQEAGENFTEMAIESPLFVSFVDEDHIAVVKGPFRKSLQEMKPAAVQVRRLHNESMRECLSLLQRPPSRSKDMEMREVRHTGENSKEHETNPPLWCRCGQCHPMPSLQEQLCCRRSAGHCISTSATFSRLVLDRQTLESVLLYRGPLLDLSQAHTSTKWLRHCAYSQYTQWRFGDVEPGSYAVIPSCSVWKIRERYPSVEGQYTGLCCEKRVLIKHDQGDK